MADRPHDSKGWVLIVVSTVSCLLATIAVSTIGMGVSQSISAGKRYVGSHSWDLNEAEFSLYMKYLWINEIFYNTSLFLIKSTFLFQYFSIIEYIICTLLPIFDNYAFCWMQFPISPHHFSKVDVYTGVFRQVRTMKTVYTIAIILNTAYGIAQIVDVIVLCWPIYGFWDHSIQARCQNPYVGIWVNAVGNLTTDIMILVLPLPVISKLRLPRRQKLALLGVFGLGFM
ncbi:hypothetical protein BX600DRAFT_518241 [Xylariales sp. PMI_506]|nr:hypothetical protein BX600DRAFT_518241 [Xylariales sp. PMI_506]